MKRHLLGNLWAALFLVLLGAVYEHFGHGVYSYYMLYAFAFPLVMGVTPYTLLLLKGKRPGRVFLDLWDSAIAAFAAGSVFRGVLDIAGYTNAKTVVYPIAGCVLAAAAVASLWITPRRTEDAYRNDRAA